MEHYLINNEELTIPEISSKYHIEPNIIEDRIMIGFKGNQIINPVRKRINVVNNQMNYELIDRFLNAIDTFKISIDDSGTVTGSVIIDGKHLTIEDVVRESHVNRNHLISLIKNKVNTFNSNDIRKTIVIGKKRFTIKKITKKYHLSRALIEDRLEEGLTGYDLIKPSNRRHDDIIINYDVYSKKEISERYHLSYFSLFKKISKDIHDDNLLIECESNHNIFIGTNPDIINEEDFLISNVLDLLQILDHDRFLDKLYLGKLSKYQFQQIRHFIRTLKRKIKINELIGNEHDINAILKPQKILYQKISLK